MIFKHICANSGFQALSFSGRAGPGYEARTPLQYPLSEFRSEGKSFTVDRFNSLVPRLCGRREDVFSPPTRPGNEASDVTAMYGRIISIHS